MLTFVRSCWPALALVGAFLLSGCQASAPSVPAPPSQESVLHFDLPYAWGGDLRCADAGKPCLLAAVEHERSRVVLVELAGRQARRLDEQPVAYHPDSAVWLTHDLLAAAVETTNSLDIFRVADGHMTRVHQIGLGFSPRDVVLVGSDSTGYRLLATPYSGNWVAWVNWSPGADDQVKRATWCQTPWHPVHVARLPGELDGGYVVACLDDKKVIAVSDHDLQGAPRTLAQFDVVPRQARPTPSGAWLYVALETGGRNARINLRTGELQWIVGTRRGAVAVAALSDDVVVWGEDRRLRLQRLDGAGKVLESRVLPTSGFSTYVKLHDIDGDGEQDALVLNSTGKVADVQYGPLWDRATPLQ